MCVKKCATKALQPPIKVVLVKEGDIYVTHIYTEEENVLGWMNLLAIGEKPSKLWKLQHLNQL